MVALSPKENAIMGIANEFSEFKENDSVALGTKKIFIRAQVPNKKPK